MIVVSDTSPVTGLITIGQAELLPAIFGEVIVPVEVHRELTLGHGAIPYFIKVCSVTNRQQVT